MQIKLGMQIQGVLLFLKLKFNKSSYFHPTSHFYLWIFQYQIHIFGVTHCRLFWKFNNVSGFLPVEFSSPFQYILLIYAFFHFPYSKLKSTFFSWFSSLHIHIHIHICICRLVNNQSYIYIYLFMVILQEGIEIHACL